MFRRGGRVSGAGLSPWSCKPIFAKKTAPLYAILSPPKSIHAAKLLLFFDLCKDLGDFFEKKCFFVAKMVSFSSRARMEPVLSPSHDRGERIVAKKGRIFGAKQPLRLG